MGRTTSKSKHNVNSSNRQVIVNLYDNEPRMKELEEVIKSYLITSNIVPSKIFVLAIRH